MKAEAEYRYSTNRSRYVANIRFEGHAWRRPGATRGTAVGRQDPNFPHRPPPVVDAVHIGEIHPVCSSYYFVGVTAVRGLDCCGGCNLQFETVSIIDII